MRLLFAGTPAVALPSLQALIDHPGHEVVGVLTRPDAASGRSRLLRPSPVAERAAEFGIEVFTPTKPTDPAFVETVAALAIDVCPVVAYGALLREPTLSLPRYGWVNLHFSLLPAWRGAAPVQHAVLRGDEFTGATTFLIGPGLDDGPVFGVLTEKIQPRDTSGDLLDRLAIAGAGLLVATLDGIADGSLYPAPQPSEGVSLAPKLTPADGEIRFDQAASAIDRRIRACTPTPGAWTNFRGDRLKLAPIDLNLPTGAENIAVLAPGVVEVGKQAVLVGTATVPLLLGDVQPPGKKPMSAADWARGVRLVSGDSLG
ncbi:methionyl-tRNA formyltransferase [Jatrophihabitans sp. DSM 45814]